MTRKASPIDLQPSAGAPDLDPVVRWLKERLKARRMSQSAQAPSSTTPASITRLTPRH